METFMVILLFFLIICAVATATIKSTFVSVIIFMAYSCVMSIIWVLLESPDLAITEAAVGVGITSILFFLTFRKINLIKKENEEDENGKK